ncbi:hypothetical protein [Nocardioides jensenii]|uniref:hypothetical protein n=1 Tax=Nocardioides jensenii TaxID=1843 RepID=UPI000832DE16|nr:hypothetical protein [Nocardioides jensenii]
MLYPSRSARELSILLRISRELAIVGDVTATVESPSELLAWATVLKSPTVMAWRAEDSAHRYLQVTAEHAREPIHGRVAAVLHAEQHRQFWDELLPQDLQPGDKHPLTPKNLSAAWAAMPITPPDESTP